MALALKGSRKYPTLPNVKDDVANHTQVLMAIKEGLEVGQRRTSDLLNSFIRVQDLIDLGLIDFQGNTTAIVGADLSQIANIGDLSGAALGDFLRYDGTDWVNDQLGTADITQTMVTQHQAALAILAAQITNPSALKPVDTPGANFVSFDGALTTPVGKVSKYMGYAGTILGVAILTEGGNGDCVVDIYKDSYANYPPNISDSITAAAKPTITTGTKYLDTTLTGWTKSIAAGDVLRFNLDSVAVFTSILCILLVQPT